MIWKQFKGGGVIWPADELRKTKSCKIRSDAHMRTLTLTHSFIFTHMDFEYPTVGVPLPASPPSAAVPSELLHITSLSLPFPSNPRHSLTHDLWVESIESVKAETLTAAHLWVGAGTLFRWHVRSTSTLVLFWRAAWVSRCAGRLPDHVLNLNHQIRALWL